MKRMKINRYKNMLRQISFKYYSLIFFLLITQAFSNADLRYKIGQMIMVGFHDINVPDSLAFDIANRNLGGVLLLARNLSDPQQIKDLTTQINESAEIPLFISVDQEGGHVARLDENNGFEETYSAYQLGTNFNSEDSTRATTAKMAQWLVQSGINMNLAPVADVNVNPSSPAIGYWERSFSNNPLTVFEHSSWFIDEFHQQNIITTLKHFPGHGSAEQDSHDGFTDVSTTWADSELVPYQMLFDQDFADFVMTGHLYNVNLDNQYPASLSGKVVTNLLRDSLGYEGLIISDEMFMRAIRDNYSFEEAIELAINAGTDIVLYITNMKDNKSLVNQIINIVAQKVSQGLIAESRIDESYQRIIDLKKKYLNYSSIQNFVDIKKPETFELYNYPNPFNANTNITLSIEQEMFINLKIYNISGELVQVLLDNKFPAGRHLSQFDGSRLPSGIYFVRVETQGMSQSRKITLIK